MAVVILELQTKPQKKSGLLETQGSVVPGPTVSYFTFNGSILFSNMIICFGCFDSQVINWSSYNKRNSLQPREIPDILVLASVS